MTAFEYFKRAQGAVRLLNGAAIRLESMRAREGVRAQRYGAIGRSGNRDVMAATDARIMAEQRIAKETEGFNATIEDAREVLAELRSANPKNPYWADMLEIRYLGDTTVMQAASALGISRSYGQVCMRCGLEWIDAHGLVK